MTMTDVILMSDFTFSGAIVPLVKLAVLIALQMFLCKQHDVRLGLILPVFATVMAVAVIVINFGSMYIGVQANLSAMLLLVVLMLLNDYTVDAIFLWMLYAHYKKQRQ